MSQRTGLSGAQQSNCPSLPCHVESDMDVLIEAAEVDNEMSDRDFLQRRHPFAVPVTLM